MLRVRCERCRPGLLGANQTLRTSWLPGAKRRAVGVDSQAPDKRVGCPPQAHLLSYITPHQTVWGKGVLSIDVHTLW
jgi:hypothetical protein